MSKPSLISSDSQLESQIIETLLAGHHEWRPDLHYPESHSDMQGAVRALLRMFDVKRRPVAIPLKYVCHNCRGAETLVEVDTAGTVLRHVTCPECRGRGHTEGT